MTRTLETRLRRLEAQYTATAGPPADVSVMPSEAWWEALGAILEQSPYHDEIMAALFAGEEDSACREPGVSPP